MSSPPETLAGDGPARPPSLDETQAVDETMAVDAAAGAPPSASASSRPIARGDYVGRYLVLARLGAGGMGEVFAAYDAELDRKVALKLLHAHGPRAASSVGRSRLLREAQAMARLNHANVVTVHDVGEHEGRVFLAMEFIAGQTLGAWLHQRERSWREIVSVFTAAGRGLAAAHAAKLIHRDFKPDNVMIGEDGRVKVMDFGLARADVDLGEASTTTRLGLQSDSFAEVLRGKLAGTEQADLSATLTQLGTLTGTPAYMAPEQFMSQATDARTDQFSFCVALHEALFDERPFPGDSPAALAFGVVQGQRRPPPQAKVPKWLRRTVDRGLAIDPDQRWPSLAVLIDELERDRVRRWRNFGLGAGALALLVGAALPWLRVDVSACENGARLIAQDWDAARAEAASEALAATGLAHAGQTWARTEPLLDDWSSRWIAAHRDACAATQLRQEQSEALMDLRMRCLDRQRRVFVMLVDDLLAADVVVVEGAVEAAQRLPKIERCADLDYVEAQLAPPDDAELAASVDDLRRELAASETLRHVSLDERRAKVQDLRERAAGLDYAPILAEAELRLGQLLAEQAQGAEAEQSLRRAYFAARAQRGLDEVAIDAAVELIYVSGELRGELDAASEWAEHAGAEIARAGTDTDEALRLARLAEVHMAQGHNAEAEALLRRALALHEGRDLGAAQIRLTLADLLQDLDRDAEALAEFEAAGEILRAELGDGHPRLGLVLLGRSQLTGGDYDEALRLVNEAIALWTETLPDDHPWLADAYNDRSIVRGKLGDDHQALADLARALDIRRRSLGPEHPSLATALMNYATNLSRVGRDEEALASYLEAERIFEQTNTASSGAASYLYLNLAMMTASEDLARARDYTRRAEAVAIDAFGPTHDMVLRTRIIGAALTVESGELDDARAAMLAMLDNLEILRGRGVSEGEILALSLAVVAAAELHLGLLDQALGHADEALALTDSMRDANLPELQLTRARILWELGREAESRALLVELRRAAAEGELDPELVRKLETWISDHQ